MKLKFGRNWKIFRTWLSF